jgi:hypothetical protein
MLHGFEMFTAPEARIKPLVVMELARGNPKR